MTQFVMERALTDTEMARIEDEAKSILTWPRAEALLVRHGITIHKGALMPYTAAMEALIGADDSGLLLVTAWPQFVGKVTNSPFWRVGSGFLGRLVTENP